MRIRVKLFATLARYAPVTGLPGMPFELELQADATLAELVQVLNLPDDMVKVMFVNGVIQEQDWKLNPGDEVGFFPPVGGGSGQ